MQPRRMTVSKPESTPAEPTPSEFWEGRYDEAGGGPIWSGKVNRTLAEVVSGLQPGTALDLGCGEGGDAIWLAGQGWDVTGIDISATAIRRAAEAARNADVDADRIRFIADDLATWQGDGSYDLVTASFLHSPVDFPRAQVLRCAAGLVAPGGHLFILSHADFPPTASDHDRHSWEEHADHEDHRFLSPSEEIEALELDPDAWTVRLAETRERDATLSDGRQATLTDVVVLLRREENAPQGLSSRRERG